MAINEGVAPYPSCLCPEFFARATTKGKDFTWRRNNNKNRSRDSADLFGMYVMKFCPATVWRE